MRNAKPILLGLSLLLQAPTAEAIRRSPTGVNVNANGATTVYITFGDLQGQTPAEGMWCGALIPAGPALGQMCDPATLFGVLPERYDQSRLSQDGNDPRRDCIADLPILGAARPAKNRGIRK